MGKDSKIPEEAPGEAVEAPPRRRPKIKYGKLASVAIMLTVHLTKVDLARFSTALRLGTFVEHTVHVSQGIGHFGWCTRAAWL